MSIRARIAVFGTLVVALALLLFGVLLDVIVTNSTPGEQDDLLRDRMTGALNGLAAAPDGIAPGVTLAPVDIGESDESFVVVTGPDGAPIAATGVIAGEAPRFDPVILARTAASGDGVTVRIGPDADEVRIAVSLWDGRGLEPGQAQAGYVVAGQSTRTLRADRIGLQLIVIAAAVFALAAAFAASWRVAGRALRPLRAILRTVDEIAASGDLGRRLPPIRPRDELGRLTTSFNAMLDRVEAAQGRLAAALANEQRLVADASHELRTPLTSIRANATFLLDHPEAAAADRTAALTDISAESAQMSFLIHDLLTLARADAGQGMDRFPRDVRPLLLAVERQAARIYPDRDIALAPAPALAGGPLVVRGNAAALRRLVWILVDNAARYSPPPGRVRLSLATDGEVATIQVSDEGPGAPEADLERVFERFAQGDAARSGGTGLGLAIARTIAAAHEGRVFAHNNHGAGATFVVELPLVRVDAGAGAVLERVSPDS